MSGPSGWGERGGHHTSLGKSFCRQILLLVGKSGDLFRSLATFLQILQFVRARVILQSRCPAFCLHYRINVKKCCRHVLWLFRFYEKFFQHAVGFIVLTAHPTIPTSLGTFRQWKQGLKMSEPTSFLLSIGVKPNPSLQKPPEPCENINNGRQKAPKR